MRYTAGEVGTNSKVTYSCGSLHMDEQKQDDQLELTYNSSMLIQDVALKTCQKQWTIERGGESGSGVSELIARHDDDDDVYIPLLHNFFISSFQYIDKTLQFLHNAQVDRCKTWTFGSCAFQFTKATNQTRSNPKCSQHLHHD